MRQFVRVSQCIMGSVSNNSSSDPSENIMFEISRLPILPPRPNYYTTIAVMYRVLPSAQSASHGSSRPPFAFCQRGRRGSLRSDRSHHLPAENRIASRDRRHDSVGRSLAELPSGDPMGGGSRGLKGIVARNERTEITGSERKRGPRVASTNPQVAQATGTTLSDTRYTE